MRRPTDLRGAPEPRLWLGAFLLLAMPLCLVLALVVPLGEVADEPAHLMRAASLADGQFVGHRETITRPDGRTATAAGVRVDPVWEALARTREPADARIAAAPVDSAVGTGPWRSTGAFVPLYTIATYVPAFYGPAAAGLRLGHALDLSARASARLGRLFNVAAYGLIGACALAVARRGQAWLFAVLALPMALSLAASFNQDGLIVATAILAAALLTGEPGAPAGRWRFAGAAVLLALILLAKPPYAPIALMLLLPLPGGAWRQVGVHVYPRLAAVVLVVLPAALWTGYATATIATPVPRAAYEAGPLWPGERPATFLGTDPAAQLKVLTADPIRFLTVPARFFLSVKHLVMLAEGTVGILGWHDRHLPKPVICLWIVALVAAAAGSGGRPACGATLALLAFASGLAVWLVLLSQYLSWSNVGDPRIDGPQGRYLLPILPIFALALGNGGAGTRRRVLRFAPIALAALGLIVVPLATL